MTIKRGRHGQGATFEKRLNFGVDPIRDLGSFILLSLTLRVRAFYDIFQHLSHIRRWISTKLG